MDILKMAWRNVRRQRRRTFVTMAAMAFGLLVMIVYAALMEGYLRGMERNVLDLEVGDVQIFADDYRENPSIHTRIEEPERLLDPLEAAGFPATGRLRGYGMAAAGDSSAGVAFVGIDMERDARVSLVHRELALGTWLEAQEPSRVVLGRQTSRTLAAKLGTELLVLSQGADGSMAYDLYTVRGVLKGIGAETDRGVFMTADAFRELMVVPDGVHQIIVRRPPGLELPLAAEQVSLLADAFDVKTWRQLLPTISSMIDSARGLIFAMFLIVYLAIGLLLLNTMLMAVFERIRELGVLKALGVGPLEVFGLVLAECAIQTGVALGIGLLLSVPALLYLSQVGLNLASLSGVTVIGLAMNPLWKAVVVPSVFFGPVSALLVIVSVAVLYPAIKASWIQPVEAMRYH